jgi:hypothetical protein
MRSLPLPLRIAAGLAATAVEHARDLPAKLAGLPVTVASQALQMSMRVQQQVTELAIKGDEALAGLRPVEETPEWATFDEDIDDDRYDVSRPAPFDRVDADGDRHEADADISPNGHELATPYDPHPAAIGDETDDSDDSDVADPWALEERALAEETFHNAATSAESAPQHAPAGVANYDELSLPQLRARLRTFSVEALEELLEHERTHANRPSFVGMLTRRIATVRDQR